MLSEEDQKLNDIFVKGLKDTHKNGVLQGARAMARVILDMANDTKQLPSKRVENIKKFCRIGLGIENEKTEPKPEQNQETSSQDITQ